MRLNEKLKILRLEQQYSVEEVARVVGTTASKIMIWEHGDECPEMSALLELSKLYVVEIEVLLDKTRDVTLNNKKKIISDDIGINGYPPFIDGKGTGEPVWETSEITKVSNESRRKKTKIYILIGVVLLFLLCVFGLFCFVTYINHEKQYNSQNMEDENLIEEVKQNEEAMLNIGNYERKFENGGSIMLEIKESVKEPSSSDIVRVIFDLTVAGASPGNRVAKISDIEARQSSNGIYSFMFLEDGRGQMGSGYLQLVDEETVFVFGYSIRDKLLHTNYALYADDEVKRTVITQNDQASELVIEEESIISERAKQMAEDCGLPEEEAKYIQDALNQGRPYGCEPKG